MKYSFLNDLGLSLCICIILISCEKENGNTGVKGVIENHRQEDEIHLVLWKWNNTNLITDIVATLTPDIDGEFNILGLVHGQSYNLTIYKGSTRPQYSSQNNNKLFMANQGSMFVIRWSESINGWTTITGWE